MFSLRLANTTNEGKTMHDFWAFLEDGRLSDDCLAEGYEQAGPILRGHLKKNIAVQHEFLEQRLPPGHKRTEISYGATMCSQTAAPAPWCLIVHDADYPAAPRALAAAVPAQLAGAPLIWSIALHEKNTSATPPPPVLAAWELSGIENVAAMTVESFLVGLRKFMNSPHLIAQGTGRVLILGAPAWSKEIYAACNDERAALLRQEGPPPRILLTGTDAKAYHAVLVALHPDADLHVAQGEEALPQNMEGAYAAVLSEKNSAPLRCDTALRLDYEHCGCWIWPELNAAFFLNHSFSLFSKL